MAIAGVEGDSGAMLGGDDRWRWGKKMMSAVGGGDVALASSSNVVLTPLHLKVQVVPDTLCDGNEEEAVFSSFFGLRSSKVFINFIDKKDSDIDKILDDLFIIRADNLKRMGQNIVEDSICEQNADLKEEQEEDGDIFDMRDIMVEDVERIKKFFTPNIPDVMVDIIQPLILKTIHTTPLDKDYVAPATKSILDDLLEEFGDEILNVSMVDEGTKCSPTKDLEEHERLLAKDPQSHYT
nr:hypothetical protein [Tanacetum cinerariifolium]